MFDENVTLDIVCPACGEETSKSLGWLKRNDHFACSGCSQTIEIDASELSRGLLDAEKALATSFKDSHKLLKR